MERQESQHTEKRETTEKPAGIGLGLGLDVDLRLKLKELSNTVEQLTDVLKTTGESVTGLVSSLVSGIRDIGLDQFKELRGKPEEEGANLYDDTVSKLRAAADRGEQEARDMLMKLGEGVESTGEKMQGAASEESSH